MNVVQEALGVLKNETEELLHVYPEVPIITNEDMTTERNWSLRFYRDFVSKNYPVLIKHGCKHFPAVSKWSSKYFNDILGEKIVTVAVTPNGYADGLAYKDKTQFFVLPEEATMSMKQFLTELEDQNNSYVCYIQKQNSNLKEDFPELFKDVDSEILWASEAFNKTPDAINFWMGDKRAITSLHKDPYENLYCVISGYKDFILIPPTDLPNVPYDKYPVGTYENVLTGNYEVAENSGIIEWISVNPLNPKHYEKFPEFSNVIQYKVRVEAGDCLYLPSLWFHHVSQSHKCIAVNYWYDMEYDLKYCYYKMLERLVKKPV